jgi:hypothetical protein
LCQDNQQQIYPLTTAFAEIGDWLTRNYRFIEKRTAVSACPHEAQTVKNRSSMFGMKQMIIKIRHHLIGLFHTLALKKPFNAE